MPDPGDRVTVRYTFTLPETAPEDGFRLPPTLLSEVNTVVVREQDAATRDDPPGTVRRMRDTGELLVKRVTVPAFGEEFCWLSLDVTANRRGAYSDEEVCGHSDYVGVVPTYPAHTRAFRVAIDSDGEYWFELEPFSWTLGSDKPPTDSINEALERRRDEPTVFTNRSWYEICHAYNAKLVHQTVRNPTVT